MAKLFKAGMYFYNQVQRKQKDGSIVTGDDYYFGTYYYHSDKERTDALMNIHNKLFENRFSGELSKKYEQVNPHQVIKSFLITEYETDKSNRVIREQEVYNETAFRKTLFRLKALHKEVSMKDTQQAVFIENCGLQIQTMGRLNTEDMNTLLAIASLKKYTQAGIRLNDLFMKSRLAKDTHPKISQIISQHEAQKPQAALTPSEIVGKRLIVANNFEECWAIRGELIKEGFDADIVSRNVIATLEAIAGNN
jgi:hypothetical protein